MFTSAFVVAFALTLFAGLSTGIGSALAFFTKRTNTKFLSVALGFSAGVMIYISFTEMLMEGQRLLIELYTPRLGMTFAVTAFFVGMFLAALIDRLVPHEENPHEMHHIEEMSDKKEAERQRKLLRLGIIAALAIGLHNLPEGLATFVAAINDLKLGVAIALAIAIHNIPEGIAISIPIYYATGSKIKAFKYSFLSGLAEPIGALIGCLVICNFFDENLATGFLFPAVAGIMVFISLDQLLPAAREYGEHHLSIYGLVAGMAIMAFSLILFV
ncbi:zinc transporter ZupT [Candidatus Peregrinibacteria bacterium]|nr:zinc transporter ZupT [Candidatus Peregrinibacteria bacterium]MBT7484345.1 zinc transporter ZupT [Candidatus Peregrinibacteria bacterium]